MLLAQPLDELARGQDGRNAQAGIHQVAVSANDGLGVCCSGERNQVIIGWITCDRRNVRWIGGQRRMSADARYVLGADMGVDVVAELGPSKHALELGK